MPEYPLFKHLIEKGTGEKVEQEYRFHPIRKWRFDFAIPDYMIAIEIEGGAHVQGRHNRAAGFIKDMEKYNTAALMGWRIFRFTPQQTGLCLDLMSVIKIQITKQKKDRL